MKIFAQAERVSLPLVCMTLRITQAAAEDGTPRGPADDLREARRLIEKHGYGRRQEELQDAEEALRQWQATAPAPSVTA